jgi:hypothetical protein
MDDNVATPNEFIGMRDAFRQIHAFLALCRLDRARLGELALTRANAAELLWDHFASSMDPDALAREECPPDRTPDWEACFFYLCDLAGPEVHLPSPSTGTSAALGVALRMVDMGVPPNAVQFRERLGEEGRRALQTSLERLLRRMCLTPTRLHYGEYVIRAKLIRRQARTTVVRLPSSTTRLPLHVLFLEARTQRLIKEGESGATDDRYIERDLLSTAPTPEDVRADVCPHTGNTTLHWAALNLGDKEWAAQRAVAIANAMQVLLRLGADPHARNHAYETPLDVAVRAWEQHAPRGSVCTAIEELLEAAMEALTARRLALCMGAHPRLGQASPLRVLDPNLLPLIHVGLGPVPPHSPQTQYADRLRTALRDEHDGLCVPVGNHTSGVMLEECVLRQRPLTPRLRRAFLVAAQVDVDDVLYGEYLRVVKHLRRVRMRFRMARRYLSNGDLYPLMEALYAVAQRQAMRCVQPRLTAFATHDGTA